MRTVQQIQADANRAVRQLRINKHKAGRPFMINSKSLPSNQSYLEYPDGTIKLVSLVSGSDDFNVIRELSITEGKAIKQKFRLD